MELSQIAARLESLHELGELVGALRSMAASRAQEAQEALTGTRAYLDVVECAMAEILALADRPQNTFPNADVSGRHLLVVTSEHGFVGGFNARLIDHACQLKDADEDMVIIGQRGQSVALERGVTGTQRFPMTSRIQGVARLARRVVRSLGDSASARIVFASHQTGASSEVTARQIIPIDPQMKPCHASPPVIQLPPVQLLISLTREYLFAEIAHTLVESLASENAARLVAMDAASRNINDKIEALERDVRVAWQEETTSDLLDVVTGAEAVNPG